MGPRDGMRCSWSRALCLACVAALACPAAAFYLPGVAPVDYGAGAPMSIKVEALTSVKTQLPYEYYVLPFCHKGVDMRAQDALNLGEVLRGTRIYETPYKFNMGVDQTCKVLCRSVYDKEELQAFALMTEEEYRVNLLLDNLPIAMPVYLEETADDGATTGKTQKLYQTGYPIGHAPGQDEQVLQKALQRTSDKNLYLFNHLKFTVLYNDFHGPQKRRVVGFEVEPMSVKHTYDNQVDWDECVNEVSGLSGKCKLNTCDAKHPVSAQSIPLVLKPDAKTQEVIWTYDVSFKASPVRWSTRWDTYLQASGEADVHWFSILNSFSVVLFLSGIVAMIMVGAIRKDLQRYDSSTAIEEGNDETGWKLVHAGVFRPPVLSGWLSVLVGSGIQLSVSGLFLIIFHAWASCPPPTAVPSPRPCSSCSCSRVLSAGMSAHGFTACSSSTNGAPMPCGRRCCTLEWSSASFLFSTSSSGAKSRPAPCRLEPFLRFSSCGSASRYRWSWLGHFSASGCSRSSTRCVRIPSRGTSRHSHFMQTLS